MSDLGGYTGGPMVLSGANSPVVFKGGFALSLLVAVVPMDGRVHHPVLPVCVWLRWLRFVLLSLSACE